MPALKGREWFLHSRRVALSVIVLGGFAALELWRFTLGHHHAPPPVWAWRDSTDAPQSTTTGGS